MKKTAIQRAIDILGVHKLSELLNVSITMIYKYRKQKYLSSDYHQIVEHETNGAVTSKDLAIDVKNYKCNFKPQVKNKQADKFLKQRSKSLHRVGKSRLRDKGVA